MQHDYDIGAAFAAIEDELIASMIRNMRRHKAEEVKEDKQWSMWQTEQLKALEKYRAQNQKKYGPRFAKINAKIEGLIRAARDEGEMEQEIAILEVIRKGFPAKRIARGASAEFFRLNEQKLEALIKATTEDMERAETAILRRADDQYRKVIYNAQVYANTGAGTYEKAVDMATRDMLAAGLTCVQYANGAMHTLADYADMAIRTASKRAYLQGEGTKRREWGLSTVIVNKRGNACPKCLPFCGKVLIDDVWSDGPKDGISPVTGLKYPLMSDAIAAGLYHPRCKDVHTTYFEGISTPPDDKYTRDELDQIAEDYRKEQKQQYAERQAEKFGRLAQHSLDGENQEKYGRKEKEWKSVAKGASSGIIELPRKLDNLREGFNFISDETFTNLTIAARKKGAVIIRGTKEAEEHLEKLGAAASNIGDVLVFRKDVCISEVLEEMHHFEQNLSGMNRDKEEPLRSILNEIDAKRYLLDVADKFKIPRNEIELTRRQLQSYQQQLEDYRKGMN